MGGWSEPPREGLENLRPPKVFAKNLEISWENTLAPVPGPKGFFGFSPWRLFISIAFPFAKYFNISSRKFSSPIHRGLYLPSPFVQRSGRNKGDGGGGIFL